MLEAEKEGIAVISASGMAVGTCFLGKSQENFWNPS